MPGKKILIVDDSETLRAILIFVLEEAGYKVISIRTPEEVEQACRNNKFDLALIGYSLTRAEKCRITR